MTGNTDRTQRPGVGRGHGGDQGRDRWCSGAWGRGVGSRGTGRGEPGEDDCSKCMMVPRR